MKKQLKKKLVKIATNIITADDINDITGMYAASKELYEKLAVLKFIEEELNDIEIDVSKNAIAAKFEELANAVMNENKQVPESNPHQEDIMIPGMDTIKDMVSEMPMSAEAEDVFADFMATPALMKNDKDLFMPVETEKKVSEEVKKSVNDTFQKEIKVGLNDRLAFVKHLFNNNMEDYNRVISQLNTITTEERSIAFIVNMVKPDYNSWQGKEEYETRFVELISRKFS
ncbi:hypothetical protein I2486_06675 [Cellulophaga sp. E16_2]|uniref:Uncharacterized protein n=1 Tax=Cellulophaga algicola (strain DSM 14237 / IC166 / ACAM 630) TaxID=688270 RepID=E6X836_CELAD|nr:MULTISPECIES: hypothetical protein [Cellulophaga]ADV48634.1 hypothetical protein Celal_1320 [Cellulophaga algicola DSM 14237]MBO0591088.1 hypothetical protein [Cellulophaga sp. E16_2]